MIQVIEIPLPPKSCSPNEESHRHWRYRSTGRKQYREEAFYAARAAHTMRFPGPVRVSVAFYVGGRRGDGRYRPRDVQNGIASIKGLLDGLIDASVIVDDNAKVLTWGSVRIISDKAEHLGRAAVVLTLEGETL